jgi:hypothetical protein
MLFSDKGRTPPKPSATALRTMISQILLPIAGTLLCYLVFHVSQILYRNLASPLRHVAGPKTPSFMAFGFIFGNFKDMMVIPEPRAAIAPDTCFVGGPLFDCEMAQRIRPHLPVQRPVQRMSNDIVFSPGRSNPPFRSANCTRLTSRR